VVIAAFRPYIGKLRRHALNQLTRSKAAIALMLAGIATAPADARRGGSFGSRGSRTYYAPRPTYGSARPVAPIERSMTPRTQASPNYAPGIGQQQPYRPAGGRFGGFGGGLLGGLVAGGLIGHFLGGGMGGGWGSGGGGGGLLASLIQIAILGGIVWLVIGFFRRRSGSPGAPVQDRFGGGSGFVPQAGGPWGGSPAAEQGYAGATTDIPLGQTDQDAFERLLIDVQDAFGREDHARLRTLTTPEIMSYLSEELSQNATRGVRNEVSGTRLLDAEVSEAWREAGTDYATIALRYEGVDVMRDRSTGAIVSGSVATPTETTELWTFVRDQSGVWKLSAIQES
jgi:predicted lipid-binding transport protein (Tim44 family)